jgi:hypothetical protein
MSRIIIIILFCYVTIFSQIKFDADFESGNMESVTTSDSVYYEVTTVKDIGGRWFYFRITGVKNKFIKVKITTSDVNRPMYSYDDKTYIRFTESESPEESYFEKTFLRDTVYVAYYTPYTFKYLQSRLEEWGKNRYVKIDTLGFTEHNLPVQEMVVTDFSVPDSNKFRVWIHARTHPGETPSSWHFDGIVQELLTDNASIKYYLKKIIFYLYPFDNPEGVYFGRSRTNYYGVDQERDWNKPDSETSSAVLFLKNRMKEINSKKVLSVALNLHSQASPRPTFWIHTASSTSEYYYRREYQFANLATADLPYFIHSDYAESNLRNYFPEGFMWSNYGDKILALTYETPYDHYSNGEWVTNENLFEFGKTTVYAIAEFLQLSSGERIIIDNKDALTFGTWNNSQYEINFYGDDFLFALSGTGKNKIHFESDNLKKGKYDIYAWWTANSENASNTKFNIVTNTQNLIVEKSQKTGNGTWNLISGVSLNTPSAIKVIINDDADGTVVADAIRVVYKGELTSINEKNIVNSFELFQNYPNPFNPTTTIRFKLNKKENVKLLVFNTLGQIVAILVNSELSAGTHQIIFNSKNYNNLSSGVYYYSLITDSYSQTKGMILLK